MTTETDFFLPIPTEDQMAEIGLKDPLRVKALLEVTISEMPELAGTDVVYEAKLNYPRLRSPWRKEKDDETFETWLLWANRAWALVYHQMTSKDANAC